MADFEQGWCRVFVVYVSREVGSGIVEIHQVLILSCRQHVIAASPLCASEDHLVKAVRAYGG